MSETLSERLVRLTARVYLTAALGAYAVPFVILGVVYASMF
jgi:hypothetical protein